MFDDSGLAYWYLNIQSKKWKKKNYLYQKIE